MNSKQIQLVQGSPEWLAWRSSRLGASDHSAIFGVSPYKTKRDLWFEKAGLGSPDDEDRSYIFQRGHDVEADIRELLNEHTQTEFDPTCFELGAIFGASLDGYNQSGEILEAKLVDREALKKASDGEIPEHHRIQVQAQLFTSESDKAYWVGKAPKVKGGVVVEIGRDEKLIKTIEAEGQSFWESVQKGVVPPISDKDTLFITDPAEAAVFAQIASLKKQKDEIEAKYKTLEAQVKAMATHPKTQCGLVVITQTEKQGSIDYSKIPEVQAMAQEYLEQFRKKSSVYKTLRMKKEA